MRDDRVARAVRNMAGSYVTPAERMGKPAQRWDEAWAVDLQISLAVPPNGATILQPLSEGAIHHLLDRVEPFFAERAGGGYVVCPVDERTDLSGRGYQVFTLPCMIREPGGQAPPAPPELRIVEVADGSSLADVESVLIEAFSIPGMSPGDIFDLRALADEYRMWIGYVDGRPVTTSCAYVAAGVVGVYAVGTTADARGHGYGEALTWVATMSRPDLPATLQASAMGLPIYERMGYRTVADLTGWARER